MTAYVFTIWSLTITTANIAGIARSRRQRNVAVGRRAAQAAGQEFLRTPDAREWHADVLRGRRVHAYAERQRQSLQYRRSDNMAKLGSPYRESGYLPLFQVHDRLPQGTSFDWPQHFLESTEPRCAVVWSRSETDQSDSSHSLAYSLKGASLGDSDFYVMINAYWQALTFTIQKGSRVIGASPLILRSISK